MGYAAAARKYSDYAVSGIGAAAAHHVHYAAAAHHANPYASTHHYDPITGATNFSPVSVSSATSSATNVNSSGGSGMMSHANSPGTYFMRIVFGLLILLAISVLINIFTNYLFICKISYK